MVERICPSCQHTNPLDDRFCGKCGEALERQLPARLPETRLALAGRSLPVTWRQIGQTVAISAAALVAEAGLMWLRQRIEGGAAGTASLAARGSAPAPAATRGSAVTIISQRVVEIWDSADGHRQMVERTFWRRIDE